MLPIAGAYDNDGTIPDDRSGVWTSEAVDPRDKQVHGCFGDIANGTPYGDGTNEGIRGVKDLAQSLAEYRDVSGVGSGHVDAHAADCARRRRGVERAWVEQQAGEADASDAGPASPAWSIPEATDRRTIDVHPSISLRGR